MWHGSPLATSFIWRGENSSNVNFQTSVKVPECKIGPSEHYTTAHIYWFIDTTGVNGT
jgi:hypothetical protein